MFVRPSVLVEICKKNSLVLDEILGVKYNVVTDEWIISSDNDVNYMAKFNKV